MTATILRPSQVAAQWPSVFWPVAAATTVVVLAVSVASPPGWVSASLAVAAVVVLGIPHGAVDHLVLSHLDGGHDARTRRRVLWRYAAASAAVGLVWLASPTVALVAFLIVSVHHFGHSDLSALAIRGHRRFGVFWSRGLLVVAVPLVLHLPTAAPVLERLAGVDPLRWTWLADHRWWWAGGLVLVHLAFLGLVAPSIGSGALRREVATVGILTALFVTADPLLSFAVYFGLWHSLAHLTVLSDTLATGPSQPASLVRLALPMTAIAVFGLAVVVAGTLAVGRPELLVPVVFVFVSALTVPHMHVVERLWRDRLRR